MHVFFSRSTNGSRKQGKNVVCCSAALFLQLMPAVSFATELHNFRTSVLYGCCCSSFQFFLCAHNFLLHTAERLESKTCERVASPARYLLHQTAMAEDLSDFCWAILRSKAGFVGRERTVNFWSVEACVNWKKKKKMVGWF